MDTNLEICSYADGNLTGGAAVDEAARAHMKETGEKSYAKAMAEVVKTAREAVADDTREFKSRVRAYMSQWKIGEGEARKRVAAHDPRMKIYEADPFGPVMVTDTPPPPAVGKVTIQPWEPVVHEQPAIFAVANVLFNLPRDEYGFITLSQAAEALRPYPDELQKAASEKMDYYTRGEISIQGMAGSVSENYPRAFDAARRRYPALSALYASGRLSSQSLRELLPQILVND